MNRIGNHLVIRIPDPFDESARARLVNMGLVDRSGILIDTAMTAFAEIFTGLFYDDLCEFSNTEDMLTIFETFTALYKKEDYQHMYLFMSIQYDYMRKPLPDPVWWLAGNSAAVKEFMTLFMARYEKLMFGDGLIEQGEEVGS